MSRPVRILARAEDDANEIFVWLAKRSPAGALAWHAALRARLDSLAEGAWDGAPAAEAKDVGVDLR